MFDIGLSQLSTDQLAGELAKRFDVIVIAGVKFAAKDDMEDTELFLGKGHRINLLGLCTDAQHEIVERHNREQEKGDEKE